MPTASIRRYVPGSNEVLYYIVGNTRNFKNEFSSERDVAFVDLKRTSAATLVDFESQGTDQMVDISAISPYASAWTNYLGTDLQPVADLIEDGAGTEYEAIASVNITFNDLPDLEVSQLDDGENVLHQYLLSCGMYIDELEGQEIDYTLLETA